MAQQSAPSKSRNDRLAARMSKSPPGGIAAGAVAILVMVLALAGVLPQVLFLVGAVGLIVVAYLLDKRFKANMPAAADAPDAPPTVSTPTGWPAASQASAVPAETASSAPPTPDAGPSDGWPPAPAPAAPPATPSGPQPALLPLGDLRAEHARLTQELTDRVDDDEDVRFEKFMQLRKIEEELERQQGAPPA